MDIIWYGQALFKLKGKNASVVIDPFDPEAVGLKLPKDLEASVVLQTHGHKDHGNSGSVPGDPMVFEGPGEYEVKGVVITGISSFHDNSEGTERGLNTIFHINIDGVNVVHLGDLGQHQLTEKQVSEIGQTDILLIPVGGVYTINGDQAAKIASQLEASIVIPMHFKIEGLKPELETADKFLKEMGAENLEPQPKLSITKDRIPEETEVVVLKAN